jgi:polysaccharide export outer membrane protein
MRPLHESVSRTLVPRFFVLVFVVCLLFGVGVAQQTPSTPPGQVSPTPLSQAPATPAKNEPKQVQSVTRMDVDNRYRIGPGDLLIITTLGYPELSADARVDTKGMILLPMIEGPIQASCYTEGELSQEIGKRYLKYLKQPDVRVFVKEFGQMVAVIGAVNSPGRFQLQRRVQLLELLAYVNGPSDKAGRTVQIIHAGYAPTCSTSTDGVTDDADSPFLALKLSEVMRGSEKANPFLEPGDIVTVPEADQYFVIGNVAKPAAYPLKDGVTIGQAILLAGGTLPDTNTKKVRIVRNSAEGKKTELFVDLKVASKEQTADLILQPNDIIEVSKAGGASMVLKGMFKNMLPMVTNLPIRVVTGGIY